MPGKVLASSFVSSSSSSNTRRPCLLPSVLCLAGKHVCLRLTFSLTAMDLRKKKKKQHINLFLGRRGKFHQQENVEEGGRGKYL